MVSINRTLVRNLLISIAEQDHNIRKDKYGLTKISFHKILFDLKKKIDESNTEIINSLPYYWYYNGPFSEIVAQELENLCNDNVFIKKRHESKERHEKYDLYKLNTRPKYMSDKFFLEGKIVLEDIIQNMDLFDIQTKIKEIYDDAPYEIMTKYKFNYLDSIKELKTFIEDNEKEKFLEKYIKQTKKYLFECERYLPVDEVFYEYNDIFSNIVTDVNIFLSESNMPFLPLLIQTISLSDEAWNSLAQGIRIKQHDSYYEYNMEKWNSDFSKSLTNLNQTLAIYDIRLQKEQNLLNLNKSIDKIQDSKLMESIVLGLLDA